MILHYVKSSLRNLLRNKLYTFINLTGLTVGISSALVLFIHVRYKRDFDRFHTNKEEIFRVININKQANTRHEKTSTPVGPTSARKYSSVQETVRLGNDQVYIKRAGATEGFYETKFYWADPTVFSMFSFPLLSADHTKPLIY